MVKSYQGVRKKEEKEIKQFLVKDYMTKNLITFSPDQTIDEVVRILTYKSISGGPVVDKENKLIGIISEGDCLKQIVKGKYNNHLTMSGLVSDHMVKEVKTLSPEHTILEAANLFLELKVRRFPVLKEGRLEGQISQRDVMRAFEDISR